MAKCKALTGSAVKGLTVSIFNLVYCLIVSYNSYAEFYCIYVCISISVQSVCKRLYDLSASASNDCMIV